MVLLPPFPESAHPLASLLHLGGTFHHREQYVRGESELDDGRLTQIRAQPSQDLLDDLVKLLDLEVERLVGVRAVPPQDLS